jgi:hypothetical protein
MRRAHPRRIGLPFGSDSNVAARHVLNPAFTEPPRDVIAPGHRVLPPHFLLGSFI